jgi:hypothetical protein
MTEHTTCPACGREFQPRGRQRWCSDACRQKAFRRREASAATQPPPMTSPPSRDFIVYLCPACEQRYLGAQYCPDCQTFCRRVGPGGLCPHCDEPVAHVDLTSPA